MVAVTQSQPSPACGPSVTQGQLRSLLRSGLAADAGSSSQARVECVLCTHVTRTPVLAYRREPDMGQECVFSDQTLARTLLALHPQSLAFALVWHCRPCLLIGQEAALILSLHK